MGDFEHVAVDGRYALVFVAFNTFFGLPSQEAQVRCFARVAERLTGDGVFVIEAFVPDPTRFDGGQRVGVVDMGVDSMQLEASVHDPLTQVIKSQHVVVTDGTVTTYPVQVRYAWPAELDLMARLAGLGLRERWSDWSRSPFTAASRSHVSVYERAR
jgi:hypothetical protein